MLPFLLSSVFVVSSPENDDIRARNSCLAKAVPNTHIQTVI
ncbi:hypothetical protein VCR1J2_220045 [Vibrio coralliirubri]|nr:hypothetical protein VCR1J2_220045 [Vibrio coralliirubri]